MYTFNTFNLVKNHNKHISLFSQNSSRNWNRVTLMPFVFDWWVLGPTVLLNSNSGWSNVMVCGTYSCQLTPGNCSLRLKMVMMMMMVMGMVMYFCIAVLCVTSNDNKQTHWPRPGFPKKPVTYLTQKLHWKIMK